MDFSLMLLHWLGADAALLRGLLCGLLLPSPQVLKAGAASAKAEYLGLELTQTLCGSAQRRPWNTHSPVGYT